MEYARPAALVLFALGGSGAPAGALGSGGGAGTRGGRSMSPSKSPTKTPSRSDGAKTDGNSRRATASAKAGNGAMTDEAALQELLRALRAAKDGDFSVRLPERK